jgi:hypothetical protein
LLSIPVFILFVVHTSRREDEDDGEERKGETRIGRTGTRTRIGRRRRKKIRQ